MPITGKSLGDAARQFRDHLNSVLARTVTQRPLVLTVANNRAMLAFRAQGGLLDSAELKTKYGGVRLVIGHTCDAVVIDGEWRLRTIGYMYHIIPVDQNEPLLRWEYVREWPDDTARWCRHHLQGSIECRIGRYAIILNDIHLPTGWVTIEEVLRFCIVDLGVSPLAPDWHDILEKSYQQFKTTFTLPGEV
ncbi:MAG TPA: hypothetical protein VFB73_18850 [Chloroflexota bacterium]|nr:hypothetical protein [Chloroflexota bacterium]